MIAADCFSYLTFPSSPFFSYLTFSPHLSFPTSPFLPYLLFLSYLTIYLPTLQNTFPFIPYLSYLNFSFFFLSVSFLLYLTFLFLTYISLLTLPFKNLDINNYRKKHFYLNLLFVCFINCHHYFKLEETVSVISGDPPFKNSNARLTTVPLYVTFNSWIFT